MITDRRALIQTNRRRLLLGGASGAAAVTFGLSTPARSQTIRGTARIVIGVPPGTPLDAMARLLAEQMKPYAASTVLDVRPGAGYRLALEAAKNSPPDGSVMVLAPAGPMTLYPHIYKSLNYNPQQDFAPVSTLYTTASILAIGPMVPDSVRTLADFIGWCRSNSKQAAFGTPGGGSPMHFIGVTLARQAGFEFVHVPYQGSAPAIQNVLGGQIASAIGPVGSFVPHVQSSARRGLAISGARRGTVLPNVPTFSEAGYPTLELAEWFGILLPAKTPAEIINDLNGVIRTALRSKEVATLATNFAMETAGSSPTEFAQLIKADTDQWAPIVKASGFTPLD